MSNERSILADRDVIEDIVRRRGLSATIGLVSQVTASTNRYYQAIREVCTLDDTCYACAWDIAGALMTTTADDISRAMRRVA